MDIRLPPRRIIYAVGTAFVVVAFLSIPFHGHLPHSSAFGKQRWASTSVPLGDIRNSTLGFKKIFVSGLPSRSDRRDGLALQAAPSGLEIEFIDGVLGKDVPDKAISKTSPDSQRLSDGVISCWRAHMNADRHRNLTSALILEDDADWNIRIRDQLYDFALTAHALTQPLRGHPDVYADPTYPRPHGDVDGGSVQEMDFHKLPATVLPSTSPYGDYWDLLWAGHCGMHSAFQHGNVPKGRVIRLNDETHTRACHHVQEGVCTLGYALSQRGAQTLLHEVALKDHGRAPDRQCLTTQPSLFRHHRMAGPKSATSDIGDHGSNGEVQDTAMTDMVRWSVRLNADALMEGKTDFADQYPD
ncbi:glycosyltransferase family 25 protein [Parathielavia appendiculata]|uniref:Glycosyltransferase family 25 protein n=1 Tax=Parathielavia appendiculata TaxID=2587402 RepID=A0AAN6U0J3_9PEZI|nr:glycosyltransferase family 25 protein [Parathielavia appendiculata]